MAIRNWLEWYGAKTQPRFALFRKARLAHEHYMRDASAQGKPGFLKLEEADFRRGASDRRLLEAEPRYLKALALSREEKDFKDTAVALYQLGGSLVSVGLSVYQKDRLGEATSTAGLALGIADIAHQLGWRGLGNAAGMAGPAGNALSALTGFYDSFKAGYQYGQCMQ